MMRVLYRRYKSIRTDQEVCAKGFTVESQEMLGSLRPLLSLRERLSLFEQMETCAWVEDGKCDEGNDDLMVEEGEARGLERFRDVLAGLSSRWAAGGTWRGED